MKSKPKKKNNKHFGWKLKLALGIFTVGILLIINFLRDLPNPSKLASNDFPQSSQIFDSKGTLLYEFHSDKRRVPVPLNQVPKTLVQATIAVEDTNFYSHAGFDFKGILRGLYRTIFNRRLQGGSTLTQQLVKNALLTQERTMTRKVKEAVLTIATEILYSKDQILEMYFNQTPYGGTLYGAEAASKSIFGKNVKELDLAESALIAGLPGSPSRYSPFTHPEAAKARQELVLKRMVETKIITEVEMQKAKEEPLKYNVDPKGILAPHFVFYVKDKLVDKYGAEKVNEGGLKITTTLNEDLQNFAETAIASEIAKLKKLKVSNGAAMITEPKSGAILAMVGSKDYFANDIEGKYNVTTALRQPGSSIKPLNYATGIERGLVTAASVFDDDPTCFGQENQKAYCPTNYGGHFYGLQTLRNSLANSLNIPAVKMIKINGVEDFIASASALGITTFKDPANYGLSLTLGGGEVMMTDMAVAFGTLANMGTKVQLSSILKVVDKNGKVLEEHNYDPGNRVLSRETSYIVQQMLSDDGARSMVFGRGSMLNIKGHPEVAVKTGTTNDLRDNWTIGYTPDFVTLVWVGNNDNSKMSGVVSGTTGAAPIWNKIMTYVLKDKQVKKPPMPSDIVGMNVCNLTGQLPPDEGCETHYEYFKKDYVPSQKVSLNQNILINKDTNQVINSGTTMANVEWQNHRAVKDVTGVWYCLDCAPDPTQVGTTNPTKPTVTIE